MSAAPFAGRDDEEDDAEEEEAAAVEEEEAWEAEEEARSSTAASAACKMLPYWCFEGSFFFAAGAVFLWLFFPFFPDPRDPRGRPGPRFFAGGSTSADDDAAADEDPAPFLWLFVSFTRAAFFLWLFLSCVPLSPSSPSVILHKFDIKYDY